MEVPGDFRKYLDSMGDAWTRATSRSENVEFPDGQYHFKFQSVAPHVSLKGNFCFHFEFLCNDGDLAGETWHYYPPLKPKTLGWVMDLLSGLGHPVEMTDVPYPDVIDSVVESCGRITEESPEFTCVIQRDPVLDRQTKKQQTDEKTGQPAWFPPKPKHLRLDGETDAAATQDRGVGAVIEGASEDQMILFQVGDSVEADFQDDGWFPGVVQKINADATVQIKFDDGEVGSMSSGEIRPRVNEEDAINKLEDALTLATIKGVEIPPDLKCSEIVDLLRQKSWSSEDVSEGELRILARFEIPVSEPKKVAKKKSRKGKKAS